MTFASTTSVNLSLEDESASGIERFCNLSSLFRSESDVTLLHANVELAHDILRLIFVQVKVSLNSVCQSSGTATVHAKEFGEHLFLKK